MYPNIENITETNNFFDMTEGLNSMTNGLLFSLFLLIIFIGIMVIFRKSADFKKVLVGSSFVTTVVASLMWMGNFIGFNIVFIPLILLLASIIIYILEKS
jgi:ABC-type uncharacterized transport system fused permease/ATPase subunit